MPVLGWSEGERLRKKGHKGKLPLTPVQKLVGHENQPEASSGTIEFSERFKHLNVQAILEVPTRTRRERQYRVTRHTSFVTSKSVVGHPTSTADRLTDGPHLLLSQTPFYRPRMALSKEALG